MSSLLGFVIGCLVGGAIVAGVQAVARERSKRAVTQLEKERALLEQRLALESEGRAGLVRELTATRDDLTALLAERARLEERVTGQEREMVRNLELLHQAQEKLKDTFQALSAEALRSNNEQFLALATTSLGKFQQAAEQDLAARQKSIGALVQPVQDSLAKVGGRLDDLEKARVAAQSQLAEQLRGLVEDHLPRLERETASLARALRQPAARGRWGELQLRRVVEMAGMLDHCDFHEQASVEGEDGRLRPDLIVRLPGGRNVVVDAKTPIAAYLEAHDQAEDENARKTALAQHARQVRAHMTALGRRAYWEQFEPTPEFVVMFVPGESFFGAALEHDPALLDHGVAERVIPATPTTLIALLRAVAYGWRQEAVARNAEEIAALGKELHRRLGRLAERWGVVGQRLDRAVRAYNASLGTLESRVLVAARRLGELGAGAEGVGMAAVVPVEAVPRAVPQVEGVAASADREGM